MITNDNLGLLQVSYSAVQQANCKMITINLDVKVFGILEMIVVLFQQDFTNHR